MTSRLLEFALKRKRVSSEENEETKKTDPDEIDQRLNEELAFLVGDMDESTNQKESKISIQVNPSPKDVSKTMVAPKLGNVGENPKNEQKSDNPGKSSEVSDNNNNKTVPKTENIAGVPSNLLHPSNRAFCVFFPPKTKEQLEKEALNPPVEKGEDLSKPFKCEEPGCGVRLKAKTTLELHINTKHKGIKSFACNLCDHKSAQRANLNVHMKATHNQTEKFQCNFCEKQIDGKREIGNHIKTEHGRSIYGRSKMDDLFTIVYVTFIEP